MAQSALIQVRVEEDLKRDADELFSDLGAETIAAMEEADRISRDPNVKGYTDVDEMMRELLADV